MKIAFVTGGLPFGGSTTFLLYLTDGLRQMGVSSQVFSLTNGNPFAAEFTAAGIPVHMIDETKLIFEDRITALYQKIAEFEPTVVFANLAIDAFEMLRYMPSGVTRICMIHDPINQHLPPRYKESLDGIANVNPTWVEVTRRMTPGIPTAYLAHGIPHPGLESVRSAAPTAPLSLTYFGRLTEVKGAKLFPEIVKQLHLRAIPFRWFIYGVGPEESYLREHLAAEIQRGEVVLAPFVPRHELFQTIRQHDIFIFASEIEGGPLTLLEAMAAGLVPICCDTPCLVQEVVNPDNGFIIPRDPAKYAEIFSILHRDRPRLERLSAAARQTITEKYSLKAMAERYVNFIKSVPLKPASILWPARIKPKPIRGLSALGHMTQSTGLARQARRLIKRARS
jgi:colanic acid/amylovoran biosynthesis glycosyltransferase